MGSVEKTKNCGGLAAEGERETCIRGLIEFEIHVCGKNKTWHIQYFMTEGEEELYHSHLISKFKNTSRLCRRTHLSLERSS